MALPIRPERPAFGWTQGAIIRYSLMAASLLRRLRRDVDMMSITRQHASTMSDHGTEL
jgi:hypothetical protein